jgi:hypothetical protein
MLMEEGVLPIITDVKYCDMTAESQNSLMNRCYHCQTTVW